MYGLLVTGDFMKLADVTRNTLIHYDNIGLLKPIKTNGRGDRFYHPFQCYTVSLIKTYQMAGVSLKDIKQLLEYSSEEPSYEIYYDYAKKFRYISKTLNSRYLELLRAYRYVVKMAYLTGVFNRYRLGAEPVVDKLNLWGGVKIKIFDRQMSMRSPDFYGEINKHVYEQQGRMRDGAFPTITHFAEDEFYEGKNNVYAVSSYTLEEGERRCADLFAGDCIIVRRLGNVEALIKACDEIRDVMNAEGYVLTGDVCVLTNIFRLDSEGNRHGDRLIIAPVKKAEGKHRAACKCVHNSYVSNSFETENMRKQLLSSGEFIKTCNITRNTLNFYEKNGLIKPEHVKENRYKYYGVSQVANLINIKYLKQAEFSIEQIKELYSGGALDEDYILSRINLFRKQKKTIYEKLIETAEAQLYMRAIIMSFRWIAEIIRSNSHLTGQVQGKIFRKLPFDELTLTERKGFGTEIVKAIERGKKSPELYDFPIGMVSNSACDYESLSSINVVFQNYRRDDDIVTEGTHMVFVITCGSDDYIKKIKELKEDVEKQGYQVNGDIISLFLYIRTVDEFKVKMQCLIILPVSTAE